MAHVILGIDPGSRATGYGVIRSDGYRHEYLTSGVIRTSDESTAVRLAEIFDGVQFVIEGFSPFEAAVEEVFVARNPASALKLGQARGAALTAIAKQGVPVCGYAARQIKQMMTGYGAADKSQMQYMVQRLLSLKKSPTQDAADALAIAICHAQSQGRLARLMGG